MPVALRQLRYFKAVVEHGSFARAAEAVFVSQPAFSLQVRELETNLGWPLFERDSHGGNRPGVQFEQSGAYDFALERTFVVEMNHATSSNTEVQAKRRVNF